MSFVHLAVLAILAVLVLVTTSYDPGCDIIKLQPYAPVSVTTTCMDNIVSSVFQIFDRQGWDTLAKPLYHTSWCHKTQCPCFYQNTFCQCCDDYHVSDVATITCCSKYMFDKNENSIKVNEDCTNRKYSIPGIYGGRICYSPDKLRDYLDVCVTVTDIREEGGFISVCFKYTTTWIKKWSFENARRCITLDKDPIDIGIRKMRLPDVEWYLQHG